MMEILEAQAGKNLELAKMLFKEYADSLSFDLDFQDFERELANLPSGYAPPDGCLLIAVSAERGVGCAAVRKLSEGICEMKRLYVSPQSRGLGIGKALAKAVIAKAKGIGYTRMRLDTAPSMKTARALYVSLGFKEIEPYRYNPLEGSAFMELRLA